MILALINCLGVGPSRPVRACCVLVVYPSRASGRCRSGRAQALRGRGGQWWSRVLVFGQASLGSTLNGDSVEVLVVFF